MVSLVRPGCKRVARSSFLFRRASRSDRRMCARTTTFAPKEISWQHKKSLDSSACPLKQECVHGKLVTTYTQRMLPHTQDLTGLDSRCCCAKLTLIEKQEKETVDACLFTRIHFVQVVLKLTESLLTAQSVSSCADSRSKITFSQLQTRV